MVLSFPSSIPLRAGNEICMLPTKKSTTLKRANHAQRPLYYLRSVGRRREGRSEAAGRAESSGCHRWWWGGGGEAEDRASAVATRSIFLKQFIAYANILNVTLT